MLAVVLAAVLGASSFQAAVAEIVEEAVPEWRLVDTDDCPFALDDSCVHLAEWKGGVFETPMIDRGWVEWTPVVDCSWGEVTAGYERRGWTLSAEVLSSIVAHFDRPEWCAAILVSNEESGWDCDAANFTAAGVFQHHRRFIPARLEALGYEDDPWTAARSARSQRGNGSLAWDCDVSTEMAAALFYGNGTGWHPTWSVSRRLGLD